MANVKRFMVDLETFGRGENACVVQIGACDFNCDNRFSVNILAADACKNGAKIDGDTVIWWLGQSAEARQALLAAPFSYERDAFNSLNDYLAGADEIWSHATFDFVIIMGALHRLGIKPKFHYRAARDIRTLTALAGPIEREPRSGVHHNALDDAIFQVSYCKQALFKLLGATSGL